MRRVFLDEKELPLPRGADAAQLESGVMSVISGGVQRLVRVTPDRGRLLVETKEGWFRLIPRLAEGREERNERPDNGPVTLKAKMSGLVSAIMVEKGERVEEGQPLLVLEAMKMQNELVSPLCGTISRVMVSQGSAVKVREPLVEIAP